MSASLTFFKYQGTGNDFVLIDQLDGSEFPMSDLEGFAQQICDRHFGVGSDGLIILKPHANLKFTMDFLNPDGSRSFCGNGSRCAIRHYLDHHEDLAEFKFEAIDGEHIARKEEKLIGVNMGLKSAPVSKDEDMVVHTGSPHYIRFAGLAEGEEILSEAHKIRYSKEFKQEGINVNFVEKEGQGISMRTYERGVENETLSCGTGVTAAALAAAIKYDLNPPISVQTRGGDLNVDFDRTGDDFSTIFLYGPAVKVFKGSWEL